MSDMKRTALHEFGHVLGLDHPDQTTPPQTEDAIMTSTVTDIDSLQLDDIYGAKTLYGVAVVGIPFPPLAERFEILDRDGSIALGRDYLDPSQARRLVIDSNHYGDFKRGPGSLGGRTRKLEQSFVLRWPQLEGFPSDQGPAGAGSAVRERAASPFDCVAIGHRQ